MVVVIIIPLAFILSGCIGSTYRSGRVLEPRQVSVGGSYVHVENLESDDTPINLLALDGRLGIARSIDIGVMHVWDLSKGNDGLLAAFWGDYKVQLGNLENRVGRPYVSFGLQKGYAYDEFAKLHITCLPITITLPVEEKSSVFVMYKHELFDETFMPSTYENPRRTFLIGSEILLRSPLTKQFVPKLGISVGTYNSLVGGEGDRGLILNVGLCVDSPRW